MFVYALMYPFERYLLFSPRLRSLRTYCIRYRVFASSMWHRFWMFRLLVFMLSLSFPVFRSFRLGLCDSMVWSCMGRGL